MSKTLSNFEFISASFTLANPLQETKVTSVSFSMFELNKRLSKTNLYLYFLYFVNLWITVSELIEYLLDQENHDPCLECRVFESCQLFQGSLVFFSRLFYFSSIAVYQN